MELQEYGDIAKRATTTTTMMTTTTTATTATAGPSRVVETVNPPEILSSSISRSDVMTPDPESVPNAPESNYCRICRQDSSSETPETLCNCEFPRGLVHISCLNRELTNLNIGRCEFCNYVFVVERTRRPIYQWTKNKGKIIMRTLIGCGMLGINISWLAMLMRTSQGFHSTSIISINSVCYCFMFGISLCGSYSWFQFILESWKKWSDDNYEIRVNRRPHREVYDVASRNNEHLSLDIEEIPL